MCDMTKADVTNLIQQTAKRMPQMSFSEILIKYNRYKMVKLLSVSSLVTNTAQPCWYKLQFAGFEAVHLQNEAKNQAMIISWHSITGISLLNHHCVAPQGTRKIVVL
jgi:hypothetical protein